APRAVAVDAQDARRGELRSQGLFHALRAAPERLEVYVAAGRTGTRHAFFRSAVVATKAGNRGMQHQARRAACATGRPPARLAGEHRGVAAAVDEDEALLASFQTFADRVQNLGGEAVLRALEAQIEGANRREPRAGCGAL